MLKLHGALLMQLWEAGIYFHPHWIGPFIADIGNYPALSKKSSELVSSRLPTHDARATIHGSGFPGVRSNQQ